MIVLGIDTSTPATVLGLGLADGRTLQARDDPSGEQRPGHATRLLALAHDLLEQASLDWSEIERIAVGVGPGTFTGLRIGVATARALAQSLEVELVGVSSLRALAYGAQAQRTGSGVDGRLGVLAVIDARRGEVFAAAYDEQIELVPAHPLAPEAVGGLLERATLGTSIERWLLVGDGAVRYRDEALEHCGDFVPERSSADSALSLPVSVPVIVADSQSELHRIQASALCALGGAASEEEAPVLPDYRRRPDAEIALRGAAS
jgi:tRNA threonylcarbamoyladenosine biosynthesis protein TsaB